MLQDTREKMMWNLLGGGANDYLIYDRQGYIFAYGCSKKTCTNLPSFTNDITSKEGYENLQSFLVLAANSNPIARCGARKTDPLLKHFAPTSAAENEALKVDGRQRRQPRRECSPSQTRPLLLEDRYRI